MGKKKTDAPAAPKGAAAKPAKAAAKKEVVQEEEGSFDFAVNQAKLMQAKKHAQDLGHKPGTAAHVEATRARYAELKGAFRDGSAPAAPKGRSRVVNLADHDGSADTAEDINDGEDDTDE